MIRYIIVITLFSTLFSIVSATTTTATTLAEKLQFNSTNIAGAGNSFEIIETFCQTYWARCSAISVVFGLIILCTIVGNSFVIAAVVLERNLHNVANYLIVSLAVADLMVAVMVMPIAAYQEVTNFWALGKILCDIWTSFDVVCCTASILHLVAIALDRYWAISKVDYGAKRTNTRIISMIAFIWFLSTIISILPHVFGLSYDDTLLTANGTQQQYCQLTDNLAYQLFSTLGAFYLPLIVMCIIYWKIFQAAKFRIRKKAFHRPNVDMVKIISNSNTNLNQYTVPQKLPPKTADATKNSVGNIKKQGLLSGTDAVVNSNSPTSSHQNSPSLKPVHNGAANSASEFKYNVVPTVEIEEDFNTKINFHDKQQKQQKDTLSNTTSEAGTSVDDYDDGESFSRMNEDDHEENESTEDKKRLGIVRNVVKKYSLASIKSTLSNKFSNRGSSFKDILGRKSVILKSIKYFQDISSKSNRSKGKKGNDEEDGRQEQQQEEATTRSDGDDALLSMDTPTNNESEYSVYDTNKLINKNIDIENYLLNDSDSNLKMYIDTNLTDSNVSMFNANQQKRQKQNVKVPIAIQESDLLSCCSSLDDAVSFTSKNTNRIKYSISNMTSSTILTGSTQNNKNKRDMPSSISFDFKSYSNDANTERIRKRVQKGNKRSIPEPLNLRDISSKITTTTTATTISEQQQEPCETIAETVITATATTVTTEGDAIAQKQETPKQIVLQQQPVVAHTYTKVFTSVTKILPSSLTSYSIANASPTPTLKSFANNSSFKTSSNGTASTKMKRGKTKCKRRNKIDIKRERKAAKTLGIIMSCFILCWLPFFIMQIIKSVCKECANALSDNSIVTILTWSGYLNSLLNPVIYTIFSPDFRNAFAKILFGKYRKKKQKFYKKPK